MVNDDYSNIFFNWSDKIKEYKNSSTRIPAPHELDAYMNLDKLRPIFENIDELRNYLVGEKEFLKASATLSPKQKNLLKENIEQSDRLVFVMEEGLI